MLRQFLRQYSPRSKTGTEVRQSGALPYMVIDKRLVFLLVTSRRTGRWIFPKGTISSGMTPWDSAAKEAMEEAGVTGAVGSEALGTYRGSDKGALIDVDIYPLCVEAQHDTWDEMDQRLRHWALLAETRRLLANRSLGHIAVLLHEQLTAQRVIR